MQDTNLACPDLNGVVDKIGHALQCLIAPHSSHIDFLLKVYLLLMHIVSGLGADERAFWISRLIWPLLTFSNCSSLTVLLIIPNATTACFPCSSITVPAETCPLRRTLSPTSITSLLNIGWAVTFVSVSSVRSVP